MTTKFFNLSDEISTSIKQINANTKELAESLSVVSKSSELIAENTSNISNDNEHIVAKAEENKDQASKLNELVDKFKLQ